MNLGRHLVLSFNKCISSITVQIFMQLTATWIPPKRGDALPVPLLVSSGFWEILPFEITNLEQHNLHRASQLPPTSIDGPSKHLKIFVMSGISFYSKHPPVLTTFCHLTWIPHHWPPWHSHSSKSAIACHCPSQNVLLKLSTLPMLHSAPNIVRVLFFVIRHSFF